MKRELERGATDRERRRIRERVRGEEQSDVGSTGGPIVMNRWWGERRLSLFLWVSLEPTPCCVDRCVDGPLASAPHLSPPLPGRCCQKTASLCSKTHSFICLCSLLFLDSDTATTAPPPPTPQRVTFLAFSLASVCLGGAVM